MSLLLVKLRKAASMSLTAVSECVYGVERERERECVRCGGGGGGEWEVWSAKVITEYAQSLTQQLSMDTHTTYVGHH